VIKAFILCFSVIFKLDFQFVFFQSYLTRIIPFLLVLLVNFSVFTYVKVILFLHSWFFYVLSVMCYRI